MFFEQRQLTRTTQLALRPHGLYVCQRNGRGRTLLEFEMPYEEVLPVRVERTTSTPQLKWLPFALFWVATSVLQHAAKRPGGLTNLEWAAAFGAGLLVVGVYVYGQNNWWKHFTLGTARATINLLDRPSQRHTLDHFAQALDQRTKAYLKEHYAAVNPLGIIEPQLQRLHWLKHLNVVSEAEARALATRLTGQVPAAPLVSMGQVLDAPYVN
ncbi:hypothetical protein [Hymenobacter cellulosivorans]|uniref:Uncharacterized protein n=1 Tax=Hymenobacter cellulosivorans TaxID=2932249 RepID=A0ABY4FI71_9BACT|nr:hypothetical protein [Hymenobacter cellulosivorans]UOQ55637.1 hypothetical protein MUN80_12955 [Hymenobacter cellulosivorans]